MNGLIRSAEAELGPALVRVCLLAAAAGIVALAVAPMAGAQAAAFSALAASFLFFAGLAAGGLALSAAARLVHGRFLEPALHLAESPAAFFPAALAILALVLLTARQWMPAIAQRSFLSLFARDFAAAVALAAAGTWFARSSEKSRWTDPRVPLAAVVYLLLYVLSLSVWAIDLVMALTDSAPSGIVPVQTFMAAFLSAVAWATLFVARRSMGSTLQHDLGRLLYGFSCFWAYLVWCSFLPVWYANLPEEVGEVLARVDGGWEWVSWAIVVAVFVVPFVALLSEAAKRNRILVGLGATSVLGGLYAERFLLVVRPAMPGTDVRALACEAVVAAGVAGAFLLIVAARLSRAKTSVASA
jgi:hypothetical protein